MCPEIGNDNPLDDLKAALLAAMEVKPVRLDDEVDEIEREAKRLERWLGVQARVTPPRDNPEVIAALTAAISFVTPMANDATSVVLALSIQGPSSARAFRLIKSWNAATVSRA